MRIEAKHGAQGRGGSRDATMPPPQIIEGDPRSLTVKDSWSGDRVEEERGFTEQWRGKKGRRPVEKQCE